MEERFHWDAASGMQGWQVLGAGVSGFASTSGQALERGEDGQSHVYAAVDCISNCEDGSEDPGWGNDKIWGLVSTTSCTRRFVGGVRFHADGAAVLQLPSPWETRDNANDLLFVRSPPFSNPVRISFDIMGGGGLATNPVHMPTSELDVHDGFLGVCLRKTVDGTFPKCAVIDCGSVANGWDGSVSCDSRAAERGWQSSGLSTWQHIEWDVGDFEVTDTVTQFTLEIIE